VRRLDSSNVDSRVWLASTWTFIAFTDPFRVYIHSRLGGWVDFVFVCLFVVIKPENTDYFSFRSGQLRSKSIVILLKLSLCSISNESISSLTFSCNHDLLKAF